MLLIQLISPVVRASNVSTIGPIRLLPKKGSFAWKATVDRATGLASSQESSRVPQRSTLFRILDQHDTVRKLSKDLFSDYPSWLCRFHVTFGFLKAVQSNENGSYEIQDRIFGIRLLTFGKARTRALTRKTVQRKNNESPKQLSTSTVTLPITGGLLSRTVPRKSKSAMVFTLTALRSMESSTLPLQSCRIVTELSGFRPLLAGEAPIRPFRACLYLSTQSIIHAHVMWRLHRRCWNYSEGRKIQWWSSD